MESELARALAANRELATETLRIQEADRKHLAREMHDELGQYLMAIKLDAALITAALPSGAADALHGTESIMRTVDRLSAVVSRMIAGLRPVALDELGVVAALEHNVEEWRQRLPAISIRLLCLGDLDRIEETLSLSLYRLIQKSITNVCKHANASQIEINLEAPGGVTGGGELALTVLDNGRGMDLGAPTSGHGLRGMRERVELAGGRFFVESKPAHGLRLCARLPLALKPT